MTDRNPIHLGENLRLSIRRYLQAALPVSDRYPRLRGEIAHALDESERLVKGPYVEALTDFVKGPSLADLCRENGLLHPDFRLLEPEILKRPLHQHQAQALEAIVGRSENVVVTTGTGSGKTECFLYPILDNLLKETDLEKPGVRALLVYPLNALANDQLYKRLAPLFVGQFASKGIRIGRYTGLTEHRGRDEAEAQILNAEPFFSDKLGWTKIPSQWQLTREEMLDKPPHVLVTNYAMLEHLLLFPKNASLFHNAPLRFIVLDEVHTYAGAQATEVAFLLRKLLRRLHLDSAQVRGIGTSASFGRGENVDTEVKEFASRLFGAPFAQVIRGKRQRHSLLMKEPDKQFSLSAAEWVQEGSKMTTGSVDGAALAERFATNRELRAVVETLSKEDKKDAVVPFTELARQVFGTDPQARDGLSGLISVGIRCRRRDGEFPLLPARYHFFTNSVDNVTVRLSASQPEKFEFAKIGNQFEDENGLLYRLLTCRKCGQPFIEGYIDGTRVLSRPPQNGQSQRVVFLLADQTDASDDEDDATDPTNNTPAPEYWELNPLSGERVTRATDLKCAWNLRQHRQTPIPGSAS